MFDFSKEEYEQIIDKLMLNEEMAKILEYRIKNYSIVEISLKMNMSTATVNRRIKKLKNKIKRVI